MLDAAKYPIYEGCKKDHSPLSAATRMMTIKSDFNLAEDCVDVIADFVKDYLPKIIYVQLLTTRSINLFRV